jgi:hypothetical protein
VYLKRCSGFALLCASLSMVAPASGGAQDSPFSPEAKQKAEALTWMPVIQPLRSGERTILVTEALPPRQQSSNRLPLWPTTAKERVIVPLSN